MKGVKKPDKGKYDIFISYRRVGGAQYARILQLELEKRGYRVFLDYEELTDGVFSENIKYAISVAPIFLMVLTPNYLDRCIYEGDWVREEILLAIKQRKHFIPVNPDNSFDKIPEDIPSEIKQIVGSHQHSEVNFGQLLGASIDRLVKNRVAVHVSKRKHSYAKLFVAFVAAIVALGLAVVSVLYVFSQQRDSKADLNKLKAVAEEYAKPIEKTSRQMINWSPDINAVQLRTVCSILNNMVKVVGGAFAQGAAKNANGEYDDLVCIKLETPQITQTVKTFFIGKYEVSTAQWYGVMGGKYIEIDSLMPMANVSFDECKLFTKRLSDLTGLNFRLPSEAEWEFAARGGLEEDNTFFAGSDEPEKVAWYGKNSKGKPHVCDAFNSPLFPNSLDLYDMSGNLSEWCDTPFRPYDPNVNIPNPSSMVVRGGYFDSEPYELTVFHREPKLPSAKDETVGLRIVIGEDIND